jgi:hypothetical protein
MKKLDVPCFSPRRINPGLTCIAMCLSYLKADRKPRYAHLQWEEELYQYARETNYPPNSPESLVKIVREYGKFSRFSQHATIEQCEDHLDGGFPVCLHGYFTPSGHIVVLTGYEDGDFLVHDPYGEWFLTGYRADVPGAFQKHPYEFIREICGDEGTLWAHFISN